MAKAESGKEEGKWKSDVREEEDLKSGGRRRTDGCPEEDGPTYRLATHPLDEHLISRNVLGSYEEDLESAPHESREDEGTYQQDGS